MTLGETNSLNPFLAKTTKISCKREALRIVLEMPIPVLIKSTVHQTFVRGENYAKSAQTLLYWPVMKFLFATIYILIWIISANAAEICSRTATINFQEVLIDRSSIRKGEGLKHYLERVPKAQMYLEDYQRGTQTKWQNAVLGTSGIALILGGMVTNDDNKNKNSFLISGLIVSAINFFITRTLSEANESNLIRAIEEYNKNSSPKIHLNTSRVNQIKLSKSWYF